MKNCPVPSRENDYPKGESSGFQILAKIVKPTEYKPLDEGEIYVAKDINDFIENHFDFLEYEALWIDGDCYCPIHIEKYRKIPTPKGFGILVKTFKNDGEYFTRDNSLKGCLFLIDELRPDLSDEKRVNLKINHIVGNILGKIPRFSPLGYGWDFKSMEEYVKEIES